MEKETNKTRSSNARLSTEVPEICPTPDTPVDGTGKKVVLLIAILAGFITPFDGSAVNIALPTLGAEFHMDAIDLSWVATAYLLSSALFLVPFGKIADIYGRKKIFLYGITIFSLSSLIMTMVSSAEMLIGVRVVQGIGSAMIFGTGVAIVTSVFPPGERGRALGIYITAVYVGLSIGPLLGGAMTQYFGWRSIFFVNIPIGITAILLILWKVKGEWAECRGEKFDLTGSVIYGAAVAAVMYGFSVLPAFKGAALIAVGFLGIIIFALYEMRIPFPVLDITLLTKNRIFAFSNLSALINYSATFAVTFLLSLDLQYTKGFSPGHAGSILVVQPVVMAMISPIAGRLSDRIEPRIVASAGMAFTALGLFFLIFLTEATPIWYLVVALIILGIGFGLFSSPNTNAIMSSVDKRFYGVASGMNGTMRLLGQMLSMGIAMMIFAIVIGPVEITPPYYSQFSLSLHYAFILFTVFCIIGVFTSLERGKRSQTVHSSIPEKSKK
ncbi:MAG: MFS transporter [Methanosarcina sp.]|jgi:EmrB/QacA subfamily drug resistance transporter|nr:MFS transporter [Methanosarcina sp.]MDD3873710.1 MFS transporter [Methanosarcina sp.]MDD4522800.1 MFS transporter [Methanosarcina sp.]HHV23390.1 MFS transporter [Methanosarcina sp.]